MLTYFVIISLVFLIIFIFSSKTFSPIPYFPSQPVDLPKIVRVFDLRSNQTVVDLGAGDGIVIFRAAQEAYRLKLDTQFIAVEINPVLILILYLRRFFHSNRKNIRIVRDDIFKMDLKRYTLYVKRYTFYLYISPWYLEKTISNIKKQIEKFSVVSYMYPIKSLKDKQKIIEGKNKIFIYNAK